MARSTASVERLKEGVDRILSKTVDATVHLPLGIYDRTREELGDIDARQVRRSLVGLVDDFIDRGQDRVQPLERRLRREGRKVEAGVSEALSEANLKAEKSTRTAKERAKKTTRTAKKTSARTAKKTTAAAGNAKPKLPRATAPRAASDLPIGGYASLTVDEIASRLSSLSQTELAKVYKYEKAHENRATVLGAVEGKLVDLPIPTYDALNVEETVKRLERLGEPELKTIKRYEAETRKRATVLEKIDSLLS